MYAAYHLKADELNADVVQTLKDVYHQREIVILSKDAYEEMGKAAAQCGVYRKAASGVSGTLRKAGL